MVDVRQLTVIPDVQFGGVKTASTVAQFQTDDGQIGFNLGNIFRDLGDIVRTTGGQYIQALADREISEIENQGSIPSSPTPQQPIPTSREQSGPNYALLIGGVAVAGAAIWIISK